MKTNSIETIPILWGSDGALYGYYAKQLLLGNMLSFTSEYVPAYLLFTMVKLSSIELDKIMFYSPAFLASLSVIPVIIIGHTYKILKFSFFVSIIGSITYAYYTRSFLGYYDTDILNVFLSLTIIAFMILTIEKKDARYLIPTILSIILFSLWYHSSKLIIFAIISNFILYILLWKRKQIFQKKLVVLLIIVVSMIIGALYHNEINSFFFRAYDYIFKMQNIHLLQDNNKKLLFKSALSTINEAKGLPINKIGKYLSINNCYFILSFIALIIFNIRFRSFLLTISLFAISLLSIKAGIRFSEYGVLIIAFGSVYLIYIFKNLLKYFNINRYLTNIIFTFSLLFLISSYISVVINKNRFLHPVFSEQSINILHKLDKNIKNNDFILTWWDYGWPLWYFTKANTLIDNGKHFEDNYIISKLLFSNQPYTARASRYFMQQCEGRRCYLSKKLFKHNSPSEVDNIIQKSKTKTKTKDVYFFFHSRMVKIMEVVSSFSNISLETGLKNKDRIVKIFKIKKLNNNIYITKNKGITLDIKNKSFNVKNKKFSLYNIDIVDNNITNLKSKHSKSTLHAIVYKNRYIILCNTNIYNSFIIQALVLDNHDKRYFKLVDKGNEVKILKLLN